MDGDNPHVYVYKFLKDHFSEEVAKNVYKKQKNVIEVRFSDFT